VSKTITVVTINPNINQFYITIEDIISLRNYVNHYFVNFLRSKSAENEPGITNSLIVYQIVTMIIINLLKITNHFTQEK
jgi:hypothetical protein